MERFPSPRHYFSYCRLVPGAANSGGKSHHRRSKEGNRYLKATFSHAALRAIQYYPEIKAFCQKKVRRKNRFLDQVDFNGTLKGVPLSHLKPLEWPRSSGKDHFPNGLPYPLRKSFSMVLDGVRVPHLNDFHVSGQRHFLPAADVCEVAHEAVQERRHLLKHGKPPLNYLLTTPPEVLQRLKPPVDPKPPATLLIQSARPE